MLLLQTEQNGCVEKKVRIVRDGGGNGYKGPTLQKDRGTTGGSRVALASGLGLLGYHFFADAIPAFFD